MARDAEFRARITADDQASKTLDDVAKAADKLDGSTASVAVEADDAATETLDEVTTGTEQLDGTEASVAVDADDAASGTLDEVTGAVEDLDGTAAEVSVEADDEATDTLADVQGAVDDLDGAQAEVSVEVDDQASAAIDDIGTSVGGLQDALGSLPGPIGEVSGLLSGLPAGLAGVGAGVAAFGAAVGSSIAQFQELGIAVQNFVTKTGTSFEDASRIIEATGDLGIGIDGVESAIGRMNRTAETTPAKFDAIGAAVVRNADGTLNAKETFIGVIDALAGIEDAGQRADAGFQIFGKGWAAMAPLIGAGADDLRARLDDVADSKIFTEDKSGQARALSDAFDSIADAADDLKLKLAGALAPAVAKLAPAFGDAVGALGPLVEGLGDGLVPILEVATPLVKAFADSLKTWTSIDVPDWLEPLKGALESVFNPVTHLTDKWNELRNELGSTPELAGGLAEGLNGVSVAADSTATALDNTKTKFADTATALETWADATAQAVEGMQAYADALNGQDWGKADLEGASAAMSAFSEQHFALTDIAAAAEESYDNFSASIEKNGTTFDVATEKGRANQAALEEVASTLDTKLAAAYTSSGGDMDVFVGKAAAISAEATGRLMPALDGSGLSAEDLAGKLGLLPEDIETRYKLSGDEEAKVKIGLLNTAIDDLPKDVQTKVTQQIIMGDYQGALATIQGYYNAHPATVQVRTEFVRTSGAGFMLGGTSGKAAPAATGLTATTATPTAVAVPGAQAAPAVRISVPVTVDLDEVADEFKVAIREAFPPGVALEQAERIADAIGPEIASIGDEQEAALAAGVRELRTALGTISDEQEASLAAGIKELTAVRATPTAQPAAPKEDPNTKVLVDILDTLRQTSAQDRTLNMLLVNQLQMAEQRRSVAMEVRTAAMTLRAGRA